MARVMAKAMALTRIMDILTKEITPMAKAMQAALMESRIVMAIIPAEKVVV